jgi:hypothetical protein
LGVVKARVERAPTDREVFLAARSRSGDAADCSVSTLCLRSRRNLPVVQRVCQVFVCMVACYIRQTMYAGQVCLLRRWLRGARRVAAAATITVDSTNEDPRPGRRAPPLARWGTIGDDRVVRLDLRARVGRSRERECVLPLGGAERGGRPPDSHPQRHPACRPAGHADADAIAGVLQSSFAATLRLPRGARRRPKCGVGWLKWCSHGGVRVAPTPCRREHNAPIHEAGIEHETRDDARSGGGPPCRIRIPLRQQ